LLIADRTVLLFTGDPFRAIQHDTIQRNGEDQSELDEFDAAINDWHGGHHGGIDRVHSLLDRGRSWEYIQKATGYSRATIARIAKHKQAA
jgi:hypothetical protein